MKKNSAIILLFSVLLLSACSVRPRGVLSSSEMEQVLYEVHRAEGILFAQGYQYGHDEQVAKYYQVILDKHGITQAQFDSSLVWYIDHPLIYNKIYPKVVARLQKELNQIELEQKEQLAANVPTMQSIQEDAQSGTESQYPEIKSLSVKSKRKASEWQQIVIKGLPLPPLPTDSNRHQVALLPSQLVLDSLTCQD